VNTKHVAFVGILNFKGFDIKCIFISYTITQCESYGGELTCI